MAKRKRKSQKSKQARLRAPYNYPFNEISDGRFVYGDKDGGYDNWIPIRDKDLDIDRSKYLSKANASALLPKSHQKKKQNRYT